MGSPLFMRDVTLTLRLADPGTDPVVAYECEIKTAEIEAKAGSDVTYATLCPDGSFSSRGKTTYSLHLVAAQSWAADGLAAFLWDNDGELLLFQYQAHGTGTVPTADMPGMAGTCTAIAPSYGGEVDTYAELDVTMPCDGKPTKIVAAFPATAATEEAPAETAAA
jgi:hypothetical protein